MAQKLDSGSLFTEEKYKTHFKIYAGPGAGKTHFLVKNIRNIIEQNPEIKNSANKKILCITYTNAAADEIKVRLLEYSENVCVSTIHSFIIDYIIKPYQNELRKIIKSDFNIDVPTDSNITSQIEGLSLLSGIEREEIFKYIESGNFELDYSKGKMCQVEVDIKKYCTDNILEIKKDQYNKIDEVHKMPIKNFIWCIAQKLSHDEILYFGYKIALNPIVTYALRVQFPYILVDEFQDTNPLQARLIKHIGQKHSIIGVIGDKAQSIYSFQGAKPQEFTDFKIAIDDISQYEISGNRRSTQDIIHLCNYIRQNDALIQTPNKNNKRNVVKFLVGDDSQYQTYIENLINNKTMVLTRTWALAFNYMQGINPEELKLLKDIYNSYYNTSTNIMEDIKEHNKIDWVRATRFIIDLKNAVDSKSTENILLSFNLYSDIKKMKKAKKLTLKILLLLIQFTKNYVSQINNESKITDLFDSFNDSFNKNENLKSLFKQYLKKDVNSLNYLNYISEYDGEDRINNLKLLDFYTANNLFSHVFCENSSYMTIHQAKGREFDKVIVDLEPTKRINKTNFIDMFCNHDTTAEDEKSEVTRLFFVGCSRAINELYIRIRGNESDKQRIDQALREYKVKNSITDNFYEFL